MKEFAKVSTVLESNIKAIRPCTEAMKNMLGAICLLAY